LTQNLLTKLIKLYLNYYSTPVFNNMSSRLVETEFLKAPTISPWEFELVHERPVPIRGGPVTPNMANRTGSENILTMSAEPQFNSAKAAQLIQTNVAGTVSKGTGNISKRAFHKPAEPNAKESKTGRSAKPKPIPKSRRKVHHNSNLKMCRSYTLAKVFESFESFYGLIPGRTELTMTERFDDLEKVIELARYEKQNRHES
jgi:hypothetical protein